jgi:four helix bundle protein
MKVGKRNVKDLRVYNGAFSAALEIFIMTKKFPAEEKFSMIDQMRRSSRSVCANLAEAWRKRRYRAAFIAKLNDAESEACETLVWLEMARSCEYLDESDFERLYSVYDHIIAQIVRMIMTADHWVIPTKK